MHKDYDLVYQPIESLEEIMGVPIVVEHLREPNGALLHINEESFIVC